MDSFWILLAFAILFFLFLFLTKPTTPSIIKPMKWSSLPDEPIPIPSRNVDLQKQEDLESAAHLAQFYQNAPSTVFVDNPRKRIGDCPKSKPFSSDLPLVDVPRCMSLQKNTDFHLI